MPIAFLIARFAWGLVRTVSLLSHPRLIRRLPWRYIYTLTRTRRPTTIAAATLALTIPLTAAGVANTNALRASLLVGGLGVTASWLADRKGGRNEIRAGASRFLGAFLRRSPTNDRP
jgi:hypothetical protein